MALTNLAFNQGKIAITTLCQKGWGLGETLYIITWGIGEKSVPIF